MAGQRASCAQSSQGTNDISKRRQHLLGVHRKSRRKCCRAHATPRPKGAAPATGHDAPAWLAPTADGAGCAKGCQPAQHGAPSDLEHRHGSTADGAQHWEELVPLCCALGRRVSACSLASGSLTLSPSIPLARSLVAPGAPPSVLICNLAPSCRRWLACLMHASSAAHSAGPEETLLPACMGRE